MDLGDALLQILIAKGVKTVYGVPGDYALGLFDRFEKCPDITLVCPAGEEGAAFAADAEAQLTGGIGVCLVTYGVGALRVMNPVGGAYAVKSRVLVISGAPGMAERDQHPHDHLHHVHKTVETQMRIFREVCTEVGELGSPMTAVATIHKVLAAMMAESRPGFLQVPRDQLTIPLATPMPPLQTRKRVFDDLEVVSRRQKALSFKLLQWLRTRRNPLLILGMEIQRFGLQEHVKRIIQREGWKWAESLTAKSVLEENASLVGTYAGSMSAPATREAVETSDGILMIGLPLSDIDSGVYTMNIDSEHLAVLSMDRGLEWNHTNIYCRDLTCVELLKTWNEEESVAPASHDSTMKEANSKMDASEEPPRKRRSDVARLVEALQATHVVDVEEETAMELLRVWNKAQKKAKSKAEGSTMEMLTSPSFYPRTGHPATVPTLTKALEAIVARHTDTVLLAETGDAMFTATEMRLPRANQFLNNGYWASLGFALPGALGAWYATQKRSRPLVLIGDGGFLTSCNELATLVRYRVPAVVVIFDNRGYGTLRPMLDGSFNDVPPVNHVALAKSYGCQWAQRVWSEKEVWGSLEYIFSNEKSDRPMVLSVMIDSRDTSTPLRNLCSELKKRVREPSPCYEESEEVTM